jgi:hypothetical protein
MNENAIVTLAIGEPYLSNWQKYCAAHWQEYAAKHRFDLIVLTEPLDHSPLALARSPSWQKCLIWGQDFARQYRQLVVLDCDIAINPRMAPNIIDQVPIECVGGVTTGSHIHEDLRAVLLDRLTGTQRDYRRGLEQWREAQNAAYRSYGLEPFDVGMVNGGVLVGSPERHCGLFEQVYAVRCRETRGYEQVPLSHALLSAGVFLEIDTRFNSVFYETVVMHYPYLLKKGLPGFEELAKYAVHVQHVNNFFLHFAYDLDFMRFLPA